MSSSSVAVKVSPTLRELFDKANKIAACRSIVVKIDEEGNATNIADRRSSVSMQRDFGDLKGAVDPPCFVLFRLAGQQNWLLVSFVPDDCAVKERMLYASSKDGLLSALGHSYFSEQLQVTEESELTFDNYQSTCCASSASTDKPYSANELIHQKVLASEEAERQWRANQHRSAASSSTSQPGVSKNIGNDEMIGGYHAVQMPFSASAKQEVSKLSSSADFVELRIDAARSGTEAVGSATSVGSLQGFKSKLSTTEPRFYVFKNGSTAYFVYHCPEKAPINIRMVYATAKPSVRQQVEAQGVRIAKALETRDPSDISADSFRSAVRHSFGGSPNVVRSTQYNSSSSPTPSWVANRGRPSGRPSGMSSSHGGTVNARSSNKVGSPHPVYNMISARGGGNAGRRTTKKIVMPPAGAYN
eukprot:CAMPEP_0201552684 /NCGR_PEP_ID=MMETSP0173_2-20130828/16856_1 /ASSEMBLY_ACC=CAM_ASM_000268 /TAXON_ID=218659 /ORGANISM="Vexillifera sp., Strain DIVA3 564/2" /LENGTH=415 /DNA_ID=CAMNT_0047963201 /DNA_START=38 /DNA_END=1285 /DNA_ORIENTATION=-